MFNVTYEKNKLFSKSEEIRGGKNESRKISPQCVWLAGCAEHSDPTNLLCFLSSLRSWFSFSRVILLRRGNDCSGTCHKHATAPEPLLFRNVPGRANLALCCVCVVGSVLGKREIKMTTSSIRRQMKNIVNNYSEAEIKVREATSNDPWGPSSSLMTEIADLTYNVVAFSEIMSMIWKRLNDHGKNWRHVYKALTLLDYLIKTGSERVAQQCKENIFAIQTLKDFQYIDRDGKDQGINVREKSKQLVSLLKDDERLKTERAQALKTKERMAQVATGVGSNQITFGRGSSQPNLSTSYSEQEYGKSGGSPASYHGCEYSKLIPSPFPCLLLGVAVSDWCLWEGEELGSLCICSVLLMSLQMPG